MRVKLPTTTRIIAWIASAWFHKPSIFHGIRGRAQPESLGPAIALRFSADAPPPSAASSDSRAAANRSTRVLGDPLLWLGFGAYAGVFPAHATGLGHAIGSTPYGDLRSDAAVEPSNLAQSRPS